MTIRRNTLALRTAGPLAEAALWFAFVALVLLFCVGVRAIDFAVVPALAGCAAASALRGAGRARRGDLAASVRAMPAAKLRAAVRQAALARKRAER